MTDDELTEIAIAIIRAHGTSSCVGYTVPAEPFCDTAPEGYPLCAACQLAADAIRAALQRVQQDAKDN